MSETRKRTCWIPHPGKYLGIAAVVMLVVGGCGASPPGQPLPAVQALAETAPVTSSGDAADDPAIWIHPQDPALSLVLGTDKQSGLAVYDLSGKQLQYLGDGEINNVDVRTLSRAEGAPLHLAAATDQTHSRIAIYRIDPATRRVARMDRGNIAVEEPYGLCLYHSRRTDDLYVIATDTGGGLHQWRLAITGAGAVDAQPVRQLEVGSASEGCVADDENGWLFVAEEDVGIWRYGAEPDTGERRVSIARVQPHGKLSADVEGLAIYLQDRGGYLVASSQGANAYAVYGRDPPHALRGLFRIGAGAVDGASETDGLDVTSTPLPGYPRGLLVVQDGDNTEPAANQNFKYVSWEEVMARLNSNRSNR